MTEYFLKVKDHFGNFYVTTTQYESVPNPNATYSKGTIKYGIVTGTDASDYPNNGYQNGYYYIRTISQ